MIKTDIKRDIRELDTNDLASFLSENQEKSYRAKQIYEWIWNKSALSFEKMGNIPLSTRDLLAQNFNFLPVKLLSMQISEDRTIKFVFQLHDNKVIEGVLIPEGERMTACISSQVGCSLTCTFCATGYMKMQRNLKASEIYDQVVLINASARQHYNKKLTNIVLMGMGEPLLNYKSVLQALELITSPQGLGYSIQRITLSTAGISKMIKRLADDNFRSKLAISLHAADDPKRNQIMPINRDNNLAELSDALIYYSQKTGNQVTLEYILFDGFNDSKDDASNLVAFASKFPSKVNIIEYNSVSKSHFRGASEKKTQSFRQELVKKGIQVYIRRSRGKDIDAACGQLANKTEITTRGKIN